MSIGCEFRIAEESNHIPVEWYLWLILSIYALFSEPLNFTCVAVVSLATLECIFFNRNNILTIELNQRKICGIIEASKTKRVNCIQDLQGSFMSLTLVPVLTTAVIRQQPSLILAKHLRWILYHVPFAWKGVANCWTVAAIRISLFFGLHPLHFQSIDDAPYLLQWGLLLSIAQLLFHKNPSLQTIFTEGECTVVTFLLCISFIGWLLYFDKSMIDADNLYHHLALAVVLGSLFGSVATEAAGIKDIRDKLKLLLMIPIVVLNHFFYATSLSFSFWLDWMFDFLFRIETNHTAWDLLPIWPRICWIAYWAIILVVFVLPSAIDTKTTRLPSTLNIIVTRKWFHGIAVALFTPTSLAAPKLQSLAYAIALALLIVLEVIRVDVPVLNCFYLRFVDRRKNESGDALIISHIALIAGCAAPLWIAEFCWVDDETIPKSSRTFLSLWGILCLGVGDAMSAVIGTYLGRHPWSMGNHRTMEGSLGMFLSMALPCWLLLDNVWIWLPAVVFTTALEACTQQLDNLVLPLAGAAVILLSQH